MQTSFVRPSLRVASLSVLPIRSARIHQLRRRLATAFFLGDQTCAGSQLIGTITFKSLLHRLHGHDFRITPETDYQDICALVLLLNMAIDDGSLLRVSDSDEIAKTSFNEDIDQIVSRLKMIWQSISDTGGIYTARTDAKNALEWVQHRIGFSVRTRRVPKRDIYDMAQQSARMEAKQQLSMQNFLGRITTPRLGPDDIMNV